MNVDKYIYSRPNKANRTDLHCTIDYWSEVEEQSVERTGNIGLIVVELWSCMSRSSQALAPHKHSLLTSTGFDDQKQMTLEGSQWPKNRWQCSQWPKTNVLEGFLMTVLFQVTEQKPEYSQNRNKNIHRTEPGYSNDRKLLKPGWRAGDDVALMTRRWWCGTDLMKLQQMNGSPWTAMGALQHNKPKKRMAISWQVYIGCWRFLYQTNRLDA